LSLTYSLGYNTHSNYYLGHPPQQNCPIVNECGRHVTCDVSGHLNCMPGWSGSDCNTVVSGGLADCSMDNELSVFYKSTWEGSIRCPSDCVANMSVRLFVTKASHGGVTATAFLGSNSIAVTGNYASYTKHLLLQSSNNVYFPFMFGGQHYTDVEVNGALRSATEMTGAAIFLSRRPGDARTCHGSTTTLKETCALRLTRSQVTFDPCNGQGQCWRYGGKQRDYMCCCNSGN
ncbi:hypothetical protein MAR_037149, partial [Mya arenaria]